MTLENLVNGSAGTHRCIEAEHEEQCCSRKLEPIASSLAVSGSSKGCAARPQHASAVPPF